tara:strand:+ start:2811 stop:3167 length:357 start_codon:yes stop_codon:yes gene_type:complete
MSDKKKREKARGRRRPSLPPPLEDPGKKPQKKRPSSSVIIQPGGYKSPRLKEPEKKRRPTISDEIKKFVKDEIMKGNERTRPKVAPPLSGGGRVENGHDITDARGSGSARPQKFRKNG